LSDSMAGQIDSAAGSIDGAPPIQPCPVCIRLV